MGNTQYLIPVAVITNSENKILFVKKLTARSADCVDKWELPGGTIEFGESFEQSLQRKIKQYLGLMIEVDSIIPTVQSRTTIGDENGQSVDIQFHIIGALCEIIGDYQVVPQEGKIGEYAWMSVDEFIDLPEDQRVPGDAAILKASSI